MSASGRSLLTALAVASVMMVVVASTAGLAEGRGQSYPTSAYIEYVKPVPGGMQIKLTEPKGVQFGMSWWNAYQLAGQALREYEGLTHERFPRSRTSLANEIWLHCIFYYQNPGRANPIDAMFRDAWWNGYGYFVN